MVRIASRKLLLAATLAAVTMSGASAFAQSTSTPPPPADPVTGTNPEPQVTGTNPEPQDDIIQEILAILHLA